jgi:hypothetical protein
MDWGSLLEGLANKGIDYYGKREVAKQEAKLLEQKNQIGQSYYEGMVAASSKVSPVLVIGGAVGLVVLVALLARR